VRPRHAARFTLAAALGLLSAHEGFTFWQFLALFTFCLLNLFFGLMDLDFELKP
jgi:hypothetical protein